ncbi:MAG TPA: SDR family oxidoreductase [Caulobacteraceae bacterium]|jgi:uncharacterized protein YbjT (DUF2867 family)|nr:SDR family oxidoreductase [Caulobacteraceae bacterium]
MRILVIGAYGLIGGYVAARLNADGHEVVGAGRDVAMAQRRFASLRWVKADLARMTVEDWAPPLAGVEAVVNCAGALQDNPRDDLEAVHAGGLERLLDACASAGVRRFVHLSAASVEEGRPTAFNTTKWKGEGVVEASDVDWVILRPGLVLAPAAYGGTALLRGLAAFPLCLPVVFAQSRIQTVFIDDVVEAVVRSLAPGAPARVKIDLVHPNDVRLGELVASLRAWLGLKPAPIVPVPAFVARSTALISDALAWFGWRSPMRTAAVEQLRLGVGGDGGAARRALGIELRSLLQTLAAWPSSVQDRWFARLYFVKPALLVGLSLFWILSGVIGLTAGSPGAVAVVRSTGLPDATAATFAALGGGVDIALGCLLAFRRYTRVALLGMLAVSAAYLIGGSLWAPGLWSDPLGALLKVVPVMLATCATLAMLDER